MGVTKMLTFYRKGPFDIKAEYADATTLIPGTAKELGSYRVEVPPSQENKKVKVRAKLTLHGTFVIEGAQLVEEEEYEDTVKEKREIVPEAPKEGGEPPAEAAPA